MNQTKEKNVIGQKLKIYRIRSGMTQLELENNLGLATGSLTKIESGKVFPGRETLIKFINCLNLNPHESAILLGFSVSKITEIIDVINNLMILKDEFEIAQEAVNQIPKILGLLGASFCLVYKDELRGLAITQSWYTDILLNIMPFKPEDYKVSLSDNKNNLMVKSINENLSVRGEKLIEFTQPFLSPRMAHLLQKTAGVKTLLAVPMLSKNEKIGVILYVKNNNLDFEEEIPLLNSYTKAICILIAKLRQKSF